MMKHEFEQIAGYEVSDKTYNEIIEPMYMAVNLDKQAFVKLLDKKAFALPTRAEMKRQMRKIANEIFMNCGSRAFHEEESELDNIAKEYAKRFYNLDWTHDMKAYVYTVKAHACYGVRTERGCTFPEEVVIGWDNREYERIILIA
jgi:hypothetical protein